MVKVALIGAGKMGISHLSILGAHPEVNIVGVCDTSKVVLDVLEKYSGFSCFSDYKKMLDTVKPDAVFVAVPTKFHAVVVEELLKRNIHIFSEKPFCLNPEEGRKLLQITKTKTGLINQVGYHNKFIGTFREVKKLLESKCIGEVYHFVGEAYGPVVTKTKQSSWRSKPEEGGGCLTDYAAHVIDLLIYLLGPVKKVRGSVCKCVYSDTVEDAVVSLIDLESNISGLLSVNWSDDTYRKMSTTVTIIGKQGKIISDANELKVYIKGSECPKGYVRGWNIKHVTDLTESVNFYLRGEEYSAQVDHFIQAVDGKKTESTNTFESAWMTDVAMDLIKQSVNNN